MFLLLICIGWGCLFVFDCSDTLNYFGFSCLRWWLDFIDLCFKRVLVSCFELVFGVLLCVVFMFNRDYLWRLIAVLWWILVWV